MIRELYETEQYREETHLDRDAVAQVVGPYDFLNIIWLFALNTLILSDID